MDIRKSILKNHETFEKEIENLLQYASEIICGIPYSRQIKKEEKYLILESLVLRACAFWELFLEKEVIFCTLLDTKNIKAEFGLTPNTRLTAELVRAIIFSDRYRDLHDLERTKGFYKKILCERYNLLLNVSKDQINKISFIYKIRNYLSHYSTFSKKTLIEGYMGLYKQNNFQKPGLFLNHGKGDRFMKLLSAFKMASINMRKLIK